MDLATSLSVKQYLLDRQLTSFQSAFSGGVLKITVLDNKQVKSIGLALEELKERFNFRVENPVKSVNFKAIPGAEPKYNAYGGKVKKVYSYDEVKDDFDNKAAVNINRRVFVVSSTPQTLSMDSVTDHCEIDPCFCLLSLQNMSKENMLELVREFPECQECFDLVCQTEKNHLLTSGK